MTSVPWSNLHCSSSGVFSIDPGFLKLLRDWIRKSTIAARVTKGRQHNNNVKQESFRETLERRRPTISSCPQLLAPDRGIVFGQVLTEWPGNEDLSQSIPATSRSSWNLFPTQRNPPLLDIVAKYYRCKLILINLWLFS